MVEKEECINGIVDYEVIVSIKKGKYYCRIPELRLVTQGNDLESCYQELKEKKGNPFKGFLIKIGVVSLTLVVLYYLGAKLILP